MKEILKDLAMIVGFGILAGIGAWIAITLAIVIASHMPQLKVEAYTVPVNKVNICAEVASGAIVPLSNNSCSSDSPSVRIPLFDNQDTIDVKMAKNALYEVSGRVYDTELEVVRNYGSQETLDPQKAGRNE